MEDIDNSTLSSDFSAFFCATRLIFVLTYIQDKRSRVYICSFSVIFSLKISRGKLSGQLFIVIIIELNFILLSCSREMENFRDILTHKGLIVR